MPSVKRLSNATIYIYADDHNPPHFHLEGADWAAVIDLGTLLIVEGEAPRAALREALDWARENRATLEKKWLEYNERD